MEIHITRNGEQWGPYSINEINEQIAEGSLQPDDFAWHDGLSEWVTVKNIQGVACKRMPPPVPPAFAKANSPSAQAAERTIWTGMPSHMQYLALYILGIITSLLLIGIFILIWIHFDRSKRKYKVTTKRVSVESGIFAKSTCEVRIQDIRSINIVRKGIEGLFGIGTVQFGTAGTAGIEVSFAGIGNAEKVKKMVSELQQ